MNELKLITFILVIVVLWQAVTINSHIKAIKSTLNMTHECQAFGRVKEIQEVYRSGMYTLLENGKVVILPLQELRAGDSVCLHNIVYSY